MLRKRAVLLYPIVLATFPLVFLAAENTADIGSPVEVVVPLAIVIGGTAVFMLIVELITKDDLKTVGIVSVLLLVFFSYGHMYEWMTENDVSVGRHRYLLPVSAAVALAGVFLVFRYQRSLLPVIRVATVATLVLVTFNLGRIGLDTFEGQDPTFDVERSIDPTSRTAVPVDQLPDIYYIILDGYGRADILSETHDFDNTEFTDSLLEKGFYVATQSRTNYVHTIFSLVSSLNMRYLNDVTEKRFDKLLKDNTVLRSAKSLGYRYVHIDSGYKITRSNRYADVEMDRQRRQPVLLSDYSVVLLKSTMAFPLALLVGWNSDTPFINDKVEIFNDITRRIRKVPDIPDPTLTFIHYFPPHPPYLFDRSGNARPEARYELEGDIWDDTGLYIGQLIHINNVIEELVDDLIADSPIEPIIIIQGDHGPASTQGEGGYADPSDRFVSERTGIFNAYLLPEPCRSTLYPTISPVNTFRLVFDACFGTKFGLLPDETYWSDDRDNSGAMPSFRLVAP